MNDGEPTTKSELKVRNAALVKKVGQLERKLAKLAKHNVAYRDAYEKQTEVLARMAELVKEQQALLEDYGRRIKTLCHDKNALESELNGLNENLRILADNFEDPRGREEVSRSQIPDSIALILDQGREPVNTTVTTLRPKLRSPPKLKRR